MRNRVQREGLCEGVRNPRGWQETLKNRVQVEEERSKVALAGIEAEGALLTERRNNAMKLLPLPDQHDAQGEGDREAWGLFALATILVAAGSALTWIALAPFRLAFPVAASICVGLAGATAGLVHLFLVYLRRGETVLLSLVSVAFLSLIFAHTSLSFLRADVIVRQASAQVSRPVVIQRGAPADASGGSEEKSPKSATVSLAEWLKKVLPFLAIGMDLGAGLMYFRGWSIFRSPLRLSQKAGEKNEKALVALVRRREWWEAWPKLFRSWYEPAARYGAENRDRIISARVAITILVVFGLLVVFVLFVSKAQAAELVVAIDLTGSTSSKDLEGVSEYQRNVEGVGRFLSETPVGCRLTLFGITDDSFGNPAVLLQASVGNDPGFFNENIETARAQLVAVWQEKADALRPAFPKTDVLGALDLAAQVFAESGDPDRVLIVASDMRHSREPIDLESPQEVDVPVLLMEVRRRGLTADLKGVRVHVLGVSTLGKSRKYWESLRSFWSAYFQLAGAELVQFSSQRNYDPTRKSCKVAPGGS